MFFGGNCSTPNLEDRKKFHSMLTWSACFWFPLGVEKTQHLLLRGFVRFENALPQTPQLLHLCPHDAQWTLQLRGDGNSWSLKIEGVTLPETNSHPWKSRMFLFQHFLYTSCMSNTLLQFWILPGIFCTWIFKFSRLQMIFMSFWGDHRPAYVQIPTLIPLEATRGHGTRSGGQRNLFARWAQSHQL